MWSMIAAVIKLATLFLGEKITRDKEKALKKKEIRQDLAAAIKTRDPSELTKAFDRSKRT